MELTVRALAEMMHLTAYEQERILRDQKYPKQGATAYRVPYYRPAQVAIAQYYRSQNNLSIIQTAILNMPNAVGNQVRVKNNVRVLDAFRASKESTRQLMPFPLATLRATIQGVSIKLTPDIAAIANGSATRIFYNFRAAVLDDDVARATIELSQYVLAQNAVNDPIQALEYVDLHRYKRHTVTRSRAATMRHAQSCCRVIKGLWPQI